MRIVLIGTVAFSYAALLHLLEIGAEVVGVCTADTNRMNSDYIDLGPVCENHRIPMCRCSDINLQETVDWIAKQRPDVIFCFGWSRLIGRSILSLPPMGVVGYHPAALPANRGRHPLIWALVLGLEKTASSFFLMDERADGGDILSQAEVLIDPTDDAGSLYQKMIDVARDQLTELVPTLAGGRICGCKQDEGKANVWRKRSSIDGLIDWRMPAHGIHNLVRALACPYPGAEIATADGIVKVWKSEVISDAPANTEPGKVLFHLNGRPIIRCGEQAICLLKTEPDFVPAPGVYL